MPATTPEEPTSFDLFELAGWFAARRRTLVVATLGAMLLAGAVSLALPKKYEATVQLYIEPAAGKRTRQLTLMSPVYLESLNTYARFALSEELFAAAVEELGLEELAGREPGDALWAAVHRNTRVLAIAARLKTPQRALELARYIAERTVENSEQVRRALAADNPQGVVSGERLVVFDAGALPAKPVSPNVIVNVVAAGLFAFIAAALYLALAFGRSRR